MLQKTYKIKVQWFTTGILWWKRTLKYYCIYEVEYTPVYKIFTYEESNSGIIDYQEPTYQTSYKLIEKHLYEQHAQVSLESWLKYNSE